MARDLRLARDIGCRDARRVVPRPEGTRSPGDGSQASHLESYALLLGSARFWGYTLCMTCSMGTLYIFFDGAPLVVGPTLETSSATLGLYIGMVPAGFVLGSYLTGRIATRMSPGPTLVLARLSTCLGLACGLILAIAGSTHPLAFFGPCAFIGIGNGLTLPTANMGVMSERRELAGTAVGLAAAISIGGGPSSLRSPACSSAAPARPGPFSACC